MNDSVYGELVANRVAEGKDFGYVHYPGTAGAYLAIVDTFVVSARPGRRECHQVPRDHR